MPNHSLDGFVEARPRPLSYSLKFVRSSSCRFVVFDAPQWAPNY